MSDRVIDLRAYLRSRTEGATPSTFSIWGGEGERSRFALPVWRAIYLAGGSWGGVISGRGDDLPGELQPFFVLDLEVEPARTSVQVEAIEDRLWRAVSPAIIDEPPGPVVVVLGEHGGRKWFLAIAGNHRGSPLEGAVRDDLLFLAGECAGLLFHRDLVHQRAPPR